MKFASYTLVLLFLVFTGLGVSAQSRQKPADPKATTMKFNTLMQLISYYYVEDVDQPKLTEEAIVAVLKELDPHSVYIPKNEVEKTNYHTSINKATTQKIELKKYCKQDKKKTSHVSREKLK